MRRRDLSIEELARMSAPVYTPPPEFDDRQAYCYEAEPDAYEHDRLAHWLANTFLALAIFAFGFFIGKSLP